MLNKYDKHDQVVNTPNSTTDIFHFFTKGVTYRTPEVNTPMLTKQSQPGSDHRHTLHVIGHLDLDYQESMEINLCIHT